MAGSDYRPLTDVWDLRADYAEALSQLAHDPSITATDTMILARSKVAFYGAYPAGFLGRARAFLCRESEPLLHICGGMAKLYPFAGLGPLDRTIDLDEATKPDYLMDVRELGVEPGDKFPEGPMRVEVHQMLPANIRTVTKVSGPPPENQLWPAALIDRPYTPDDATKYLGGQGAAVLPDLNDLLKRALTLVVPGGRVGVLDYIWPQPPKKGARCVAAISVLVGFNNRVRLYSVYEREPVQWRKLTGARGAGKKDHADEEDAEEIAAHGSLEPAQTPAPPPGPPAPILGHPSAKAAAAAQATATGGDPFLAGIMAREHVWEKREDDLASCSVCKGGEGTLPSECPGAPMDEATQAAVYSGARDYRNGAWANATSGPSATARAKAAAAKAGEPGIMAPAPVGTKLIEERTTPEAWTAMQAAKKTAAADDI